MLFNENSPAMGYIPFPYQHSCYGVHGYIYVASILHLLPVLELIIGRKGNNILGEFFPEHLPEFFPNENWKEESWNFTLISLQNLSYNIREKWRKMRHQLIELYIFKRTNHSFSPPLVMFLSSIFLLILALRNKGFYREISNKLCIHKSHAHCCTSILSFQLFKSLPLPNSLYIYFCYPNVIRHIMALLKLDVPSWPAQC